MIRTIVFCLALAVPSGAAFAQDQTLADIRAELSVLYRDVNALRQELVLEDGCDLSTLGDTPSLGGVDVEPTAPAVETPIATGPSLAVGEQQDFTRAQEALDSGDFRGAADLLETFNESYPGSPVASQAHLMRGQALERLGELTNAARAYLAAFSGAPEGPAAPEALTKLGQSLGTLGQTQDACVTLGEVAVRFPGAPQVADAQASMASLGCG